jgi:uncharacterized membrane protein
VATLTLAVSLEAIFLSSFVMIGQNRQAAFQQAKADHDFVEEVQELKLNTALTREIHELTRELHDAAGLADQGAATVRTSTRATSRRRSSPIPTSSETLHKIDKEQRL